MINEFICPDSGSKVGDIIDLKDFGKYKVTKIEEYSMDHVSIDFYVRPLYKYILELTEKCTRDIKDLKKEVAVRMNDITKVDYGDYFNYEEDYEVLEKDEYLKCPNCGSEDLHYFKYGIVGTINKSIPAWICKECEFSFGLNNKEK